MYLHIYMLHIWIMCNAWRASLHLLEVQAMRLFVTGDQRKFVKSTCVAILLKSSRRDNCPSY